MSGKKGLAAYAIVRIDEFQPVEIAPENRIKVVEVVFDEREAVAETDRLRGLAVGKPIRYFWQVTRVASSPSIAAK